MAFSVVQKIYRNVSSHLYFFLLFCFSFPPSYSCFNLFPPFLLLLSYTGGRKRWRGTAFVVTKLVRKNRPFPRHFQGFDHFFPRVLQKLTDFLNELCDFRDQKNFLCTEKDLILPRKFTKNDRIFMLPEFLFPNLVR